MSPRNIVTEHVYPPIPVRSFDWSAVFAGYDGAPDAGFQPSGWGKTKEAAVAALLESAEIECELGEPWPRRCVANVVDQDGSCWHCHALNGESCRAGTP